MTRMPVRAMRGSVLAVTVVAALVVASSRPATAHSYPSACPAMTDSISRLYHAYFQRDADPVGFEHWQAQYQQGMSLEEISAAFESSAEFSARGLGDNRAFVTWLYRDVAGVPATRTDQWVAALDEGYARGTLTLTFTESEAYVNKTATVKPLAGYLRWYPRGTHWYCGSGAATFAVKPLTGPLWADYLVQNRGPSDDSVELWTLEAIGHRHLRMVAETLQPGGADYNPDGAFAGDGDYGRYLEVKVGTTTDWIVVFYPRSLGPERPGWQFTA